MQYYTVFHNIKKKDSLLNTKKPYHTYTLWLSLEEPQKSLGVYFSWGICGYKRVTITTIEEKNPFPSISVSYLK